MTLAPLELRQSTLHEAAANTFDLVVIGGGISGVGIALDAVSRGMSTLLVERDDLAVGTSSRSSKLIHGGLRYLEQFRFGLVREALGERRLLCRLAPHLISLERFVFPVVGGWWKVPYLGAGLTIYDLLGGRHGGRFDYLSKEDAHRRVPSLRLDAVRAAYEYSDGVFDDARLVVALARTARALEAQILTRAEMIELSNSAGSNRVTLRDRIAGEELVVTSRAVVDATGPFFAEEEPGVVPSRGVHLVVARDRIESTAGMTIQVPGRVVFLVPWLGRWLIGTTDVRHTGPVDRPHASNEEIDYLFESVGEVLDVELSRADLIATYAGIRPLADIGESDDTAELSRAEKITETVPGQFRVRGGKYTTYRRVAEKVVDRVAAHLGSSRPSVTADLPLVGAAPEPIQAGTEHTLTLAGWDPEEARRLVSRHGSEAAEVAEKAVELGLTGRLVPELPYLEVEAWWAVHREHALGIDDILSRRTRVAIEIGDHGDGALEKVAAILADALGWDEQVKATEIDRYRKAATLEYGLPEPGLVKGEVER